MMTLLSIVGLLVFPLLALFIALRAIQRPERDEFLDDPDQWGAR